MRTLLALVTVLVSAGWPTVAHAVERVPTPARGVAYSPVFQDSGHRVWLGTPRWIRELGLCIRRHESWTAGHYRAHNGTSSASGAYQFLDSTWQGNAKWAKWNGVRVAARYRAANRAPEWVQDVVFIHSIRHGGIKAWRGTGCPGTD